jgi:MFS family permease
MNANPAAAPSSEAPARVSLLPVFLIVLVDVFGMTLVLPLLAIYAESFHATPLEATLLVSVYAACQFVSAPLIGHWSDRIGRKPMLVLSQIGTFIGFVMLAEAHSLWMIYLSRIIDGATAGNLSLVQAYIADNTPVEERAKSLALIGIAFGLGFFIGPSLTGYLSARYTLATPIWLAALMSAGSVVCTLTLLTGGHQGTPHAERREMLNWRTYAVYFTRPGLRERLLQFFFYIVSFSTFMSGFALFAERRYTWNGHPFTPREIGFVLGYVGLLGIILQGGLIGRLVKRYGEAPLVAAGFLSLIVGYTWLGLSYSIVTLLGVATIFSFGIGIVRPTLSSLITQYASRHEQGIVAGLTSSLNSLGNVIAPVLAGLFIQNHLLSAWAWFAGLMALVGALLTARRSPGVQPA